MNNHWRTALIHIRRSPYQAAAAVLVMMLTFFIISVFSLLAIGSEAVLDYFETRPQVIGFLKDDLPQNQLDALKDRLLDSGKVKETKYVSKETALEIYKDQSKNDPLLLEMVTAEMLPASLEISANNISDLADIAQILKDAPEVSDVTFQEDIIKSLQQITVTIRQAGVVLIAVFGIVSLLVVLIVVGMKATSRREEIEILNLIGASAWYIRWPFILEAIFYGLVSALLGWAICWLTLLYATPFLAGFLIGIPILPVSITFMMMLLGGEILVGLIIGSAAGLLAVKRYLKINK